MPPWSLHTQGQGGGVISPVSPFSRPVNNPIMGTCCAVGPVLGTRDTEKDKTELCL